MKQTYAENGRQTTVDADRKKKNDINMSVYKVDIQNNHPLKMKASKNFSEKEKMLVLLTQIHSSRNA